MISKKKIFQFCFLLVIVFIIGSYLSGLIFLLIAKGSFKYYGFTIFYRYYSSYGGSAAYTAKFAVSALFGFGIPLLLSVYLLFRLYRPKKKLYGDARFATAQDLKKAGFFKSSQTSIIIGKFNNRYLYFSGQQFVLLAAPTRSGKGVGVVIPNLLTYQGSMVVLDIKQENFDLTSRFRKRHGQAVYLFNPFATDCCSHRWNPLTYVSDDPNFRISDLQSIANMLYPIGDDSKDRFWLNQAQNVFLALTLYLFDLKAYQKKIFGPSYPKEIESPTLGRLHRLSSGDGKSNLKEYLSQLANESFVSEQARTAFSGLLSQAEETFASIMGMFNEPLLPWLNPITDAATSSNDFLLTDIRKKKMTIYIGIQPNKLSEARLIINLFFSQLINQNTRELPENNPDLKYQCLLLMDEFTSIGKVDIIAKSVSYMAGYNIRLLPIIQSLAQLDATYGREASRTLMTNHALQILYTPREQKDANDYSEMLGYTSVKRSSVSKGQSVSRTENEEQRALMLPQELKAMSSDKEIIIFEGLERPIMCNKICYYKAKAFTLRLMGKVKIPLLKIRS